MTKKIFFAVFFLTAIYSKTFAVRPFITDDAAVVGRRLFQLETWCVFDKFSGQHWNLLTFGPRERLELAIGAVCGYDRSLSGNSEFSYAMPLLAGKFLLHEYQPNKLPGIALTAGTSLLSGKGAFVTQGYGGYGYLALTQCFGKNENVLIHGNIGTNYLYVGSAVK